MIYVSTAWAAVCGVLFKEVDEGENPLFNVAYNDAINEEGLMASAFFPSSPAEDRVLWSTKIFPVHAWNSEAQAWTYTWLST